MHRTLFVIVLLISHYSFSQNYIKLSDPAECEQKLRSKSKSTTSISAEFKETVHSSMLQESKIGSGKIIFQKEKKIRWEKISPASEIILVNGNVIKFKKDDNPIPNAAATRSIKRIQALMLKLLNGDYIDQIDFSIAFYENDSTYKLVLTPKRAALSKHLSSIDLIFKKPNLSLAKFTLIESDVNFVEYEFSSGLYNEVFDESIFNNF